MIRSTGSQYFRSMQRNLFPDFAQELGETTDKHLQVIVAFDMIQVEKFTGYQSPFAVGRPPVNRDVVARAFIAKAITTVRLIPEQCPLVIALALGNLYNILSKHCIYRGFLENHNVKNLEDFVKTTAKLKLLAHNGYKDIH